MKKHRLIVAGGGTGGHILAGIAIADEWCKQELHQPAEGKTNVLFVGAKRGLEERLVPKAGYPLKLLNIGALNQVNIKTRLLTLVQLPLSFLKALWIILNFRPEAILGVGGYSSGPVVLLGRILGVKTAILEQNSVAGFTNRVLGKWVHRVFCAFEAGSVNFQLQKVLVTGNPIRSSLKRLSPSSFEGNFTIFIFGGSQGALGLNTMVLESLPFLKGKNIEIIHQTGVKDFDRVSAAYAREGVSARIEKFIDDMATCYARANLVICRAGASTLAELALVGRAAIFVPLPTAADNHQEVNAKIYEQDEAALVIRQGSISGRNFADLILSLKDNPSRVHEIERRVQKFYKNDAASVMVRELKA